MDDDPETNPSRGPENVACGCRSDSSSTPPLDRVAETPTSKATAAAAGTDRSAPLASTHQIRHTPVQKSRLPVTRRNLNTSFDRIHSMRLLRVAPALLIAIAGLVAPAVAFGSAPGQGRTVSRAGVSLRIPAGWQAETAKVVTCDPERLIVASSRPIRIGPNAGLPSPHAGAVLVVLLEDRYRQDRPPGNLHRPRHFVVTWHHLTHIKPSCGLPASPAYMRYFKTHGRYLGFIVYPGGAVTAKTRAATLRLMDSLRLNR